MQVLVDLLMELFGKEIFELFSQKLFDLTAINYLFVAFL